MSKEAREINGRDDVAGRSGITLTKSWLSIISFSGNRIPGCPEFRLNRLRNLHPSRPSGTKANEVNFETLDGGAIFGLLSVHFWIPFKFGIIFGSLLGFGTAFGFGITLRITFGSGLVLDYF